MSVNLNDTISYMDRSDNHTANLYARPTIDSPRNGVGRRGPLTSLLSDTVENGMKYQKKELIQLLYKQVGGFGRFHRIVTTTMIVDLICCNIWVASLGFILQSPTYRCTFADGDSTWTT